VKTGCLKCKYVISCRCLTFQSSSLIEAEVINNLEDSVQVDWAFSTDTKQEASREVYERRPACSKCSRYGHEYSGYDEVPNPRKSCEAAVVYSLGRQENVTFLAILEAVPLLEMMDDEERRPSRVTSGSSLCTTAGFAAFWDWGLIVSRIFMP